MKSTSKISIAAGILLGLGLATSASATMTTKNYWSMGEDNNTLPTDSVGGKNFTGNFSDVVSSVHSPALGSTSSVYYNFAGTYMANPPTDNITVPSTNFAFEVDVNFNTLNGAMTIATLGADPTGSGNNGWAQIGFSGNNIFFGRQGQSFGILDDETVQTNKWYALAYVQYDGHAHGYVNGVEATDLGFGDNNPSTNNTGQVHLGVIPGGGQNLDGYIDNVRFSTFAEGQFNVSDLISNNPVPEPATYAVFGLGAIILIRRRKRS